MFFFAKEPKGLLLSQKKQNLGDGFTSAANFALRILDLSARGAKLVLDNQVFFPLCSLGGCRYTQTPFEISGYAAILSRMARSNCDAIAQLHGSWEPLHPKGERVIVGVIHDN